MAKRPPPLAIDYVDKQRKITVHVLIVLFIIAAFCARDSFGFDIKGIADSKRINTLKVHIESNPSNAPVFAMFADGKKTNAVCVTPCDVEVGYVDQVTYKDNSEGLRSHFGGHLAWYHEKSGCFTAAALDVAWGKVPPYEYLKESEGFCVPLHIVLEGNIAIDKSVCFYDFMDKTPKDLKIDLRANNDEEIVLCSNTYKATNELTIEVPQPQSPVLKKYILRQAYTVDEGSSYGLILRKKK
ncbi:MAG TPA: hypothetical protein VMT62_16420 [Syntrophorhabdaceae bacterium]|nr:hypothetical protein [Syntrophorhabdaceae bacterium]